MFNISEHFDPLHDIVADMQLYDESNTLDPGALLPFVGAPFAYHQFRSGRSNWPSTIVSLMIGVGVTEGAFLVAGRHAGFTSSEWMLARGLSAMGVRMGGRSYMAYSLFGPRTAAGMSWGVPTWAFALGYYEYARWLHDNPEFTRAVMHEKMMLHFS